MAKQSLAEHYRAHRKAFLLAQELGCTPKEAEREIARVAAREAHRASADRLAAKINAPLTPATPAWDAPWMMRD